jgi:hypothetical protein
MTLRFLSVQLFAAIAITLANGFLPPATPGSNGMELNQALMYLDRHLASHKPTNPYEGE